MHLVASDGRIRIFRLLYRSRDLIAPEHRRTELGALFTVSRSRNKHRDVTGALLVTGIHFVQVLEGDEAAVRSLFDHIATDPRHADVDVVETAVVTDRVFARWAMAEIGLDGAADVPLIAHSDGISAAARRRPPTFEQATVLNAMRAAASDAAGRF